MPPIVRDDSDALPASTPRDRILDADGVPLVQIASKRKPRYSASTLSSHDKCARLFFWNYVCGVLTGTTFSQETGTKLHKLAEDYLRDGTVPSRFDAVGKIFTPGIKHLPIPGTPGMHIEESFEMGSFPNGPTLTGTADLWTDPPELEEYLQAQMELGNITTEWEYNEAVDIFRADFTGWVELYDHKSTSDMIWALLDDDAPPKHPDAIGQHTYLRDDVQANMYAKRLIRLYPKAAGVICKWIYYRKNSHPHSEVSTAKLTRDHINKKWEKILANLDEMSTMYKTPPALESVKPGLDHCSAYRGCPHMARCFPNVQARGLKKLFGHSGSADNKGTEGENVNFKDALKKKIQTQTEPAKETKPKAKPGVGATKAAAKEPEAPAAVKEEAKATPTPTAPKMSALDKLKKKTAPVAAAETKEEAPAASEPEASEPEAKEEAPAAAEKTKPAKATKSSATGIEKSKSFWLFVDCAPMGPAPVQRIEDFLRPIADEVAAACEAPHYSTVDFGKGPGYFYSAVKEALIANPLTGPWVASRSNKMTLDVLDLLVAQATLSAQKVG